MFLTKDVKKIDTHFALSNFFPEDFNVYEIMWNNMVRQTGTDENIVLRMGFACWMTKVTITHT